jgi:hypothetical protein
MFRRRQEDEDPFAALKEAAARGSTHVGNAQPRPAGDAPAGERRTEPRPLHLGEDPAPLRVPRASRDRRGSDRLLVLLTLVLVGGGTAALVAASDGPGATGTGTAAGDGKAGDSAQVDPAVQPQPAVGPQDGGGRPRTVALVRPAGMRATLRVLRRALKPGEQVLTLRVAPDRTAASVAGRDGRQRILKVSPALAVEPVAAGTVPPSFPRVRLAQVDPQAPWRAVRGAARTGRFPASKLDYLVLVPSSAAGRGATWSLFFTGVPAGDGSWIADGDGGAVRRTGQAGTTTSSSVTITTNGRRVQLDGAQAERIMRCVRDAGSDAERIQRCLP